MSSPQDFSGFAPAARPTSIDRWPARLVTIALAAVGIGVVVGAIIWFAVGTTTAQDIAALIWVLSFAAAIASMSIRQTLLAEEV